MHAQQLWEKHYNQIGRTFARPLQESNKDPRRPKYVTYRGNKASAFLTVRKLERTISEFLLTATIHHRGGTMDTIERKLTGAELGVLADDPTRDLNPNDPAYAASFGAEWGLPTLFLRRGNEAIFANPGTGRLGEAVFCFEVKEFFTLDMRKLLRFGRVDRELAV